MIIQRRALLRGLFAAPAIIAIDRLMPISTKLLVPDNAVGFRRNSLGEIEHFTIELKYDYQSGKITEMIWHPATKGVWDAAVARTDRPADVYLKTPYRRFTVRAGEPGFTTAESKIAGVDNV